MRRVAVFVLVVLVLGPAGVRASTWYRKAHGGELRAACCCPAARYHGSSAPAPAVRAACCCTIIELAAREAQARSTPPLTDAAPPAIAVVVSPVPPPLRPARLAALDHPWATRGPPALPDAFVRHCALLL